MGYGDASLDAGYLVIRIGECCELLGDPQAAKWCYGRAVEANPEIPAYTQARSVSPTVPSCPLGGVTPTWL